ncbi:CDP-glucose 4,6-dehydratase [Pectinatus haikarae]|uniref:CDP-glucose 4,6-dehydratase n=1 Tax=Pectinatus haikarae TaxID=349096 RepID=A0ABT9YB40_9FIRM|nr:CDP-glucose 4,6-dehydratase [Pectinatus haikarae]MDQ0205053.1 CDP-glucose 4,6-dehydratase [Pectinatus haikarae]
MIDKNFWHGKKVFITGHTGFKGSWLSLWLFEFGAQLYGYSLKPPAGENLFDCAAVEKCYKSSYINDINDFKSLKNAMAESDPDIVIHMAAQPLVRRSYDDPIYTYQTNVLGTVNFLESIKSCNNIKAALIITTDKCYENNEWCWGYRENDRLGGYDPYSSSKACAELVTSAYRQSFFGRTNVALASARAGNVIGGGDWAKDRLIPDCFKAISEKRCIKIRSPKAIRPWQHVLEALHGYLSLLEYLYSDGQQFAESWNFGPNDESAVEVRTVIDMLCDKLDGTYEICASDNSRHEAGYLKLDCSKAHSRLKWQPVLTLDKAVECTALWYESYLRGDNMHKLTLKQIETYMKMI